MQYSRTNKCFNLLASLLLEKGTVSHFQSTAPGAHTITLDDSGVGETSIAGISTL